MKGESFKSCRTLFLHEPSLTAYKTRVSAVFSSTTETLCTTSITTICKTCCKAEFKRQGVWSTQDRVLITVIESLVLKLWKCVRLTWKVNKRWTTWLRNVLSSVETAPKRLIFITLRRTVRKLIRATILSMFGPKMNLMAKRLQPNQKKIRKSKEKRRKRFKIFRMKLSLQSIHRENKIWTSLCHLSPKMKRPWVKVTRPVMGRIRRWPRKKSRTTKSKQKRDRLGKPNSKSNTIP